MTPSSAARWLLLLLILALTASAPAFAGAFIFAGEANGINIVTHPEGYSGTGGTVTVSVCIDPASPNAAAMEIPVQNIVSVYNGLTPATGNLISGGSNNIPSNAVDFESVALHEVGHCIGMAHPNLASESGLGEPDRNYTKSTDGANNVFNIGIGADGVRGSSDDLRGDDVNLHWFRESNNNPFTIAGTVDSSTYSRDQADLPSGHTFAANGDRDVSTLLGVPNTEAVMQQGSFFDEAQRTLTHDDVATLRYGMSGLDELQGTADDYTIQLTYAGLTNACDVVLDFDNSMSNFAVCRVNGVFVSGTHIAITSGQAFFNTGFNWFFNNELTPVCTAASDDLTVSNENVDIDSGDKTFEACDTITVGPNVSVESPFKATFQAGNTVIFTNGVSVEAGAELEVILALP